MQSDPFEQTLAVCPKQIMGGHVQSADHAAVDETKIQLTSNYHWLYANIDPDSNNILHVSLLQMQTQSVIDLILAEFCLQRRYDPRRR